ncbi:STAS domain-containing protein [Amycolatopsis regifaucium]|uniref:Anti-anti-sigma factor n=1 Tax=Amycolatopsis regifaucium TaxID=546365 RepID=A0A154MQM0_9PSEU|nr:STAS domain-containing protein [Amycolatopsis regifaucium]KZB86223.1 anti-anti-sigma factor [Amycolatopsis regifaucium]OKA05114.1 anti-anti-sigma factor [Amycolatopsis regifaucium]SFH82591.1 anti-anti-sigma factor [Amycolatopsis regifaucium]
MLPGKRVPGDPPPLAVTSSRRPDGVLVLTAVGEIDAATVGRFRTELSGACVSAKRVVLDLSGVGFLSCAGLHALEEANAVAPRFSVIVKTTLVSRILDISGVGADLDVRRDVEEVLN